MAEDLWTNVRSIYIWTN